MKEYASFESDLTPKGDDPKGSVSLVLCLPEKIKIQDKAVFQLNIKENQSHQLSVDHTEFYEETFEKCHDKSPKIY